MEIAALGYRVDSDGALVAAKNLDKMTVSAAKAEDQARDLAAATKRTSAATRGMGSAASGSSNGLRMAALQLSQVAQQGQVTGNYMQALAIQLPDLALGFGTLGIAAGVAAGALLPVITSLVSASNASISFEDALEQLNDTAEMLQRPLDVLNMTLDEAAAKYGEAAVAVREYARIEAELVASSARRALQEQINLLGDVLDRYTTTNDAGRNYINTLNRIADDLGVTGVAAREFEDRLEALGKARTFEEKSDQLRELLALTEEYGIALSDLPVGLQEAITRMIEFTRASEAAATTLRDVAAAAAEINTGTPLYAQGFEGDELLPPQRIPAPTRKSSRRGGGARGGAARSDPLEDLFLSADRQLADAEFQLAGIDKTRRQIAALTAEYRLLEEAKRRDIDLDRTIDESGKTVREVISEKAKAIGDLAGQYADAQDEARRYEEVTGEVSQAVSDMILEGESLGDTLESLAKSFARAALEASLFGQNGLFGQNLLGGVIGNALGGIFPGLPSFDGGGHTGGGSRSGGIDGLGGFPAILHPNETVVDHTRAATMAAVPNVEVHIHGAPPGPAPQTRSSPGRLDIFLGEAVSRAVSEGSLDGAMGQRFGLRAQGQI